MKPSFTSRRALIQLAGLSALTPSFPGLVMAATQKQHFPADFKWGAGSAAAQVESRQGRGISNWDVFIDAGQHVSDGTTNRMNTDFENRFMEDFQLLADAGVQSFRFSFAWPRIQPDNAKQLSSAGLDTYERIIDGMLEVGLEPVATIFHWDMPVWAGDFRQRDSAYLLADYAHLLTKHFGDRIPTWALLNEPNSVAFAGYALGIHAPGLNSAQDAGAAVHHQNLALGLMAQAAKANINPNKTTLTTTINLAPIRTARNQDEDIDLVSQADDFWNRSFMDPIYGKGYPLSVMPLVEPHIQGDDMEVIAIRPKTLGVNYYSPVYIKASPEAPLGFLPDPDGAPKEVIRTADYFVEPDGLIETLMRVHNHYGQPAIYLTETGFALDDAVAQNGVVKDPLREKYLKAYLQAAHQAIAQGVDLKGIYYWAATDNFEWSEGFSKKFGLIQIDEQSLNRTPKSSLSYYGNCAKANAIQP